jgi:Protein of unknown function (DUF2924)
MNLNIARESAAMHKMGAKELRLKYAEVFGETTNANNKTWLIKRIAWRLQALAEGDLSERARRRAEELANDADLRLNPPRLAAGDASEERTATQTVRFQQDNRLPPPGTILHRKYRGETLQVKVLAEGFEFEGQVYPSLSAAAKAITGGHCNGYLFFQSALNGGKP